MENSQNPRSQTIEALKPANNVLITVSANPSVDQLSAAIGLTLLLNKMGKHASAVFSGKVPSTIEFLKPEETLEKNTDSLRDFIIALDKSKADKLRYKVEDKLVKIFITPYRTSIGQEDLEFSQGDFNVDAVVALGVQKRDELDVAITAHGRILHNATVITVNTAGAGELGTVNWVDAGASSLCELVSGLAGGLEAEIDEQIATALLTGIVAETERFSNEKTSANAMTVSATLMAKGANQQLVASKLEAEMPAQPKPKKKGAIANFDDEKMQELVEEKDEPSAKSSKNQKDKPVSTDELPPPVTQDGSLAVAHEDDTSEANTASEPANEADTSAASFDQLMDDLEDGTERVEQIDIDEHGKLLRADEAAQAKAQAAETAAPSRSQITTSDGPAPSVMTEPPIMPNPNSSGTPPQNDDEPASVDMMASEAPDQVTPSEQDEDEGKELSSRGGMKTIPTPTDIANGLPMTPQTAPADLPPGVSDAPSPDNQTLTHAGPQTLSDIERSVHSPHAGDVSPVFEESTPAPEHSVDSARDAVHAAINGTDVPNEDPIAALNAQPVHLDVPGDTTAVVDSPAGFMPPVQAAPTDLPPNLVPPSMPEEQTASPIDQAMPPPVPPPIVPPMPPADPSGQPNPPANPLFPQ